MKAPWIFDKIIFMRQNKRKNNTNVWLKQRLCSVFFAIKLACLWVPLFIKHRLKWKFFKNPWTIETYIQSIYDLMQNMLIWQINGGIYSLKSTLSDWIFWETFHGNFIWFAEFFPETFWKKYFCISFRCLTSDVRPPFPIILQYLLET